MRDDLKKVYNICLTAVLDEKFEKIEDIDNFIDNLVKGLTMVFKNITEDDLEFIKNKIKTDSLVTMHIGSFIQSQEKHKKWFVSKKPELEMKYWDRYKKYLVLNKGFSTTVVNSMDDLLDNLTDLLGDPSIKKQFLRRGLVIGDVQSGKTSNYIGLMCKAADAGYKVIILLTGTIEKLRQQTQNRVDEGFVGKSSAAIFKKTESTIGVGYYDKSINPVVLTSTDHDFNKKAAKTINFDFNGVNTVLFVMKKNVSNLKSLNSWIRGCNQEGDNKIKHSLFLIDDESDNASINTNKEDENPTAINAQIRDLLNLFERSSYVGFTATPFANIFIEPETEDDMFKEDLFPKDYIYSLDSPSNYIGARDIFNENGRHKNMLVRIDEDDIESYIPLKHKSWHVVYNIPKDLKESIYTFFLANVIRDLRGDINIHRSMLINVSRFTNVQNQVHQIVNDFVKEIQDAIKLYSNLPYEEAKDNDHIFNLRRVFDKFYKDLEFTWYEVQHHLHKSTAQIKSVLVNQQNKGTLNYEENSEKGFRVIAIGGLSLSRGLTLEGLIVSYFYRNSKMYDTLMQMGRWFGYRRNYEDLCKIWMSEDSIEWYSHISDATDELKDEIKKYQDSGLTPRDFGLRVRSDINALLVTARNKMRAASSIELKISLSSVVIETPDIFSDVKINKHNLRLVRNLIMILKDKNIQMEKMKNSYGFVNVDKNLVLDFLDNMQVAPSNTSFNIASIREFIDGYAGNELKYWDVAFVSGGLNENTFDIDGEHNIAMVSRSFTLENDNKIIRMGGINSKLGGPTDGEYGLSKNEIEEVKQKYKKLRPGRSINSKAYFSLIDRKPLLLIYPIKLKDCKPQKTEESEKIKQSLEDTTLIGLGIGIPKLENLETAYAKYVINTVYRKKLWDLYDEDDGDDEE